MNIIITGSSKGIGKSMAEHYLDLGHVVVGCSRGSSGISHENYTHHQVDATDQASVRQMANLIRESHGRIDALINNAGGASMNHFLLTPPQTHARLFQLNYLSCVHFMQSFLPLLRRSENPRIVNFSTVAVPLNLPGELAYASSKAAVEMLTKISAKELSPYKITVNAIGPTPIETDLIAKVPQGKIQELIQSQTIKRMGIFKDVFNVTDFFISPNSGFITGQIIYLGGVN